MSPVDEVDHEAFYDQVIEPLQACLAPISHRIEALVLTRGFPVRVRVELPPEMNAPALTLSSAGLLTVARSTLNTVSLAHPSYGFLFAELISCAGFGPCWSPLIENPWRAGSFSPRWFEFNQGIAWAPMWVSRLDGYSVESVLELIDRAVQSDGQRNQGGAFFLMRGANSPRAILDQEFPQLASSLTEEGVPVEQVDFSVDWYQQVPIAGFVTGSEQLGLTIESNTYTRGSIIDNLTSFGAHPQNFTRGSEVQVSIARWLEQGVGGAHGTTDEPLNYAFPSRAVLLDYVRGATLVEAFSRHLPYLGWQNLIVGDPMMAPYMQRPSIEVEWDGSGQARLSASPPADQALQEFSVWRDSELIEVTNASSLSLCSPEAAQVLAIAQTRPLGGEVEERGWGGGFVRGYAKGWALLDLPPCSPDESLDEGLPVDMGGELEPSPDARVDPFDPSTPDTDQGLSESPADDPSPAPRRAGGEGCQQRVTHPAGWTLVIGLIYSLARRRRRRVVRAG